MLAKRKLALLRVAKAKLHLAEDDYRAILESCGGRLSSRELDDRGFDAVMNRFRALGFTSTARKESFGERLGMASPGQVAKIRRLWREYVGETEASESALNAFLERTANVSALRFMDTRSAHKMITALNVMIKRRSKARDH
jgi:hypothetical protein